MSAAGPPRRHSARALLRELGSLRLRFGPEASRRKLVLLAALERADLATAREVLRYHELLAFWRAYPDDAELLAAVERALERFARRADLRRFRRELADPHPRARHEAREVR
ncbi:MAG TPA: hypothetical protein VI942_09100, partial [Thermoanaerobaculia bacterium]|nr:hypothetical protein [Thermoanaerobaculia bacterium]